MTETEGSGKTRNIALVTLGILVALALGFGTEWMRGRGTRSELAELRVENQSLDLTARLGAALAEAQRGNYERARQLMAGFYSEVQTNVLTEEDPGSRELMEGFLAQRDEIITQLSRAEPESVSRLNLMYTAFFGATHPLGQNGASVTPAPQTPPP